MRPKQATSTGRDAHRRPRPQSIEAVVETLAAIEADTAAEDGLRPFVTTYRLMTECVLEYLRAGRYQDAAFVERLDVVFAQLFLDAIGGQEPVPRCWGVVLDVRAPENARRRHPLQLAVAGMNAHINYDLAIALVATCEELGREPRRHSTVHADYTVVDEILAAAFDGVKAELIRSGPVARLDRVLGERDDDLELWSLVAARSAAWERAELLWDVRHLGGVRDRYLALHDRLAAVIGRAALAPTVR